GQGLSLLTSTRISLRDHHLELVDLQGRVAAAARGATANVRLVSTESESVIEPPTCATGSRARPAPTATASRPRPRRPRSAMGSQAVAIGRCSDLAEPLCAQLAPVWELVASIPAPGCDHRQHEDPALAEQALVDTPAVLAHCSGRMGEVEFDRPTAARLEVDEQQPVLGGEHVAWVRLAVQELLGGAALADHSPQAS